MSRQRKIRPHGTRNRDGMSMVELVVAMTFLGVVLTSVAGLTVESAQRAQSLSGQTRRQAAVSAEINRLTATPWSQLVPASSCRTVNEPGFVHTRCVSVTALSTLMRRVTIVVTPNQPGVRPDTVVFTRANPPAVNPLFIP